MPACYRKDNETNWGLDFGRNLQNVIRAKNFTQGEIAKKLGITQAMLSRYIHGVSVPSVYKTCQLADAIGCDVGELIKSNYDE